MQVVYATGTAQVTTPDGGRHAVRGGEHWQAGDPVVQAAPPGLFSDDPRWGLCASVPVPDEPVEQATAGPGERRGAVRRG